MAFRVNVLSFIQLGYGSTQPRHLIKLRVGALLIISSASNHAWLFFWADINGFLGGEKDGISHLAHLLGFLSIGFLVYFLDRKEKNLLKTGLITNLISFAIFLAFWHFLSVRGFLLAPAWRR